MTLPPEFIAKLAGIATQQQLADIDKKTDECYALAESYFKRTLIRPKITFDLRGDKAGQARINNAQGIHAIRLNVDLLHSEHYQQLLNQTLPHEIAHIVQYQIWPNCQAHGYEWKLVMRVLGVPAHRTHSMPTAAARKHSKQHRYVCICPPPENEHFMSNIRHRRSQDSTGQYYKCTRCGERLVYAP